MGRKRTTDLRQLPLNIITDKDKDRTMMKRLALPLHVILIFVTSLGSALAQDYAAPGTAPITTTLGELVDDTRDRTLPYRLYRPATLSGPHPIVIFSHGLGGSREAAAYLGEHLASHGFLALHIQHPGSDQALFDGAKRPAEIARKLKASLRKPRNAVDRFEDIPFVIDTLEAWNQSGELTGHIDLGAIGMSGHSYGARSTLIAAGEKIGRRFLSFKEPRIAAAIAYSPNVPQRQKDPVKSYKEITIPILHVTGTDDQDPLRQTPTFDPSIRTLPFERIPARPQYLLVLDGADHMVFSGRIARQGQRPNDEAFWALTKAVSLAFWEATLRADPEAAAYLNGDTLREDPNVARYEVKD